LLFALAFNEVGMFWCKIGFNSGRGALELYKILVSIYFSLFVPYALLLGFRREYVTGIVTKLVRVRMK
jgi:hypothetical protein